MGCACLLAVMGWGCRCNTDAAHGIRRGCTVWSSSNSSALHRLICDHFHLTTGEVSGISFSPDSESLFVGIADLTYGSLLEYSRQRTRDRPGWQGGASGAAAAAS